ncbi:MAG: hypothetical protein SPE81_05705 [Agathobacter sp.]|nr:hypothetical protein [Agathobacter sp.]
MLTIYCALFAEAQEIIRIFQLKKENEKHHFEVFSDLEKGIRLVITGVGAVAAATAVAEISTCYPPESTDLICNFGSCGAAEEPPVGTVYLCNKLTEEISGRTFYPDICYRHPFAEAELVSCAQIRAAGGMESDREEERRRLYDMEAATIYQAANYYYGPHQMSFLKMVSDHGVDAKQTGDMRAYMTALMQNVAAETCPYFEMLCEISHAQENAHGRQALFHKRAEEQAAQLGEALHCSTVMRGELRQLLLYWNLTGTEYETVLEDYRRQGRLPAKDKREGKRILDELKARL